MRENLIFGPNFAGGAPLDPTAAVAALPDDAEICGCNGVCRSKTTGARFAATPRVKVAGFRTAEDLFFAVEDRCPLKGGSFRQGIVHGAAVTSRCTTGSFR